MGRLRHAAKSLAIVLASGLFPMAAAAGCSDKETPCQVDGGDYYMLVPEEGVRENAPAVVFLHGFGGHGGQTINNAKLIQPILDRGYVVIAPNGLPRYDGAGSTWIFHPDQEQRRDELTFINAVLEDAQTRAGFDRDRVLLSGFSAGAFVTTYIACRAPEQFAAYAPLAGGFWRPHPQNCAGPVRLLQTHGWSDGTVPIEGRPLAGGRFRQGDIFQTLQIWRDANGCDQMRADIRTADGPYWKRKWTSCAPGTALEFALHDGGHVLPQGWSDMALNWFESLPEAPLAN